MRALLLILLCTLISSCSIFKKKTKVTDFVSGSAVVKVEEKKLQRSNESNVEQSKEVEKTESESSGTIEADEITVNTDGSITFKGNAKSSFKSKSKGDKEKASGKVANKDSSGEEVSNMAFETDFRKKNTKSESKPSGSAIIYMLVGGIVFVFALLWRLGIWKKK